MRAMVGGFCLPSQRSGELDSCIPGAPLSLGTCFALKFKLFLFVFARFDRIPGPRFWVFTVDFSWK